MTRKPAHKWNVYLEVGRRRTFAAALDWPGWCRSGRDETSALESLFECAARYGRILRSARLGFHIPKAASDFVVVERLKGNATTDFGAPDVHPSCDEEPVKESDLRRFQSVLRACWRALDAAAEMAEGKMLRRGPRGGGRSLNGIVEHVLGSEKGYLSQLGGKLSQSDMSAETVRQAILKTLAASAQGEILEYGPRGGRRWSPRYFVRREAWHVLDHVWEIADRLDTTNP
jgi:hypothetical protein